MLNTCRMASSGTKIILQQGDGSVAAQYLVGEGQHVIGQDATHPIRVLHERVAAQHARLHIGPEGMEIEDLGSATGTFIDGVAVRGRVPVQPHQAIQVGPMFLRVQPQVEGELSAGKMLGGGRYVLLRELGRGARGVVWLARDNQMDEDVAIKRLPPELAADSVALNDLKRETQKCRRLSHPHIIRIHDFVKMAGEQPFVAMEYVDGANLTDLRLAQPNEVFQWEQIEPMVLQICDALDYAHGQRVVHRDLKPANLMLNHESAVRLADFGIAATMTDSLNRVSQFHAGSGTLFYMSPEQLQGSPPHVPDDIHALGATIYELLTGRPPFYTGDIAQQLMHQAAPPIEQRLAEFQRASVVPGYASELIMACLAKAPDQRPASAAVMREWIRSQGQSGPLLASQHVQAVAGPPEAALVPLPAGTQAAPSPPPASPRESILAGPWGRVRKGVRHALPKGILRWWDGLPDGARVFMFTLMITGGWLVVEGLLSLLSRKKFFTSFHHHFLWPLPF